MEADKPVHGCGERSSLHLLSSLAATPGLPRSKWQSPAPRVRINEAVAAMHLGGQITRRRRVPGRQGEPSQIHVGHQHQGFPIRDVAGCSASVSQGLARCGHSQGDAYARFGRGQRYPAERWVVLSVSPRLCVMPSFESGPRSHTVSDGDSGERGDPVAAARPEGPEEAPQGHQQVRVEPSSDDVRVPARAFRDPMQAAAGGGRSARS